MPAIGLSPFLALLLLPAAAQAAANYWTISDPDQRAYCRAIETHSAGDCSVISDYALRQTCRARFSKSPDSVCNSVGSAWERQKCKDAARPK